MSITNIGEMNRAILGKLRDLGLDFDCGCDGVFDAEIAIIGEAPGERETQLKTPLIGKSGKLLWEKLRPIGINRRSVYCTNVIKKQLRSLDDTKIAISRNEVDHYSNVLRFELSQIRNLKYIVVLGNYALESITGLRGINQHRGSVFDVSLQSMESGNFNTVKVICMMNPAAVLREPKWEIMFNFDVARLGNVLAGKHKEHIIRTNINPSPNDAIRWLDKLQDEKLPTAIDIETISNETACIGFANDPHSGYCINFRNITSNCFSLADEIRVRQRIQQFVKDPNIKLVAQNGMFDAGFLHFKDRIHIPRFWFDTMLAHHTLYPILPHGLGFLTSQYTTHPFYKDEGENWKEGGSIDSFWEYNVKDCCITIAAQQAMLKELEQQNMSEFFFNHVMRLQPHLIRMTVGGLLIDQTLKEEVRLEAEAEVKKLKQKFLNLAREAVGENEEYNPNPNSPKQMADLYFRRLRLVGRGTSVDVKNRYRMRQHPRTPQIAKELLLTHDLYAKEQKFLGTYAEMQIDEDGRCRSEYKQIGVSSAPGRLSSAATLWGSGTNLQNQPGRAHKLFIADPGYSFSYFDLSQAEARVVGWKYKINSWIEQFEQARIDGLYDAHRALASEMFDVPYNDVPKEDWNEDGSPTIRYLAKRCRHGLNYRMGADRLQETLSTDAHYVSLSRAEELWRIYHRINPELQKGWDATQAEVRKYRKLYNAYGRRWILLERYDEEALKSTIAFYPQSTVGDKVSRCIYLCENDPEWPTTARMALNIHDALVAIHKHEDGPTVRRIMKKHAEEPIEIINIYNEKTQLIIPADLKASQPDDKGIHRWSTLEKIKAV